MEEELEEYERFSFSEDHPALYDQRTAEIAEKLQRSSGFIVYFYTELERDDEGNVRGEGEASIGMSPGIPLGQFLKEGFTAINEVVGDMIAHAMEEESVEDGGDTK